MNQYKNPTWWTNENDSAWERTKAAFKRDWDQTKHDMGGKQPDTDQQVSDTVKQASGKEIIPPRGMLYCEASFRQGNHSAARHACLGQSRASLPLWLWRSFILRQKIFQMG